MTDDAGADVDLDAVIADAERIYGNLFPDASPIFVIGPARSGTTIMGRALTEGAALPGFHESFLFSTAYLMISELDRLWERIGPPLTHFATDGAEFERSRRALVRFDFAALKADVLRHFHRLSTADGETVWVDKTPDVYMVHGLPMLAAAYPRARFVFMTRNGIDVLLSRRRTHPEMTFAEGCDDWATVMADWRRIRHAAADRYLEVDQRDIALEPGTTSARVAGFLGFDTTTADAMRDVLTGQRPGRTTTRAYGDSPRLADTGWSEAEQVLFRQRCGPVMTAYGYPL